MARPLTAPELAHYRSEYQRCRLFLAAPTPATVFTARLNGTPSSTDKVYEVAYDGGSAGFADCIAGQTLFIGSEAGAYDKGVLRLRGTLAGVSGTMKIGETSEIDWSDNDYLTIVDDLALWPRHLWIDGAGVIFVDHDVAYTDQHEDCDPVPVLGTDAAKWLTGATVDVEFDASDSWVIGSTIASYSWAAPGASASSGMATATPTITYDAANVNGYRVACTVTATNGKSFTGYRRAYVYDANNQPVTTFRLDDCSGDWASGGWQFKVTLWGEATRAEIRDRAQIIFFARDWYGSTEISIGPVDDRENVVCVGRIAGESIEWHPEQGSVSFKVQGPQYWMSKMTGFPSGLEDFAGTPTGWVEFEDLTVDKGLWHFLHWRTTATLCVDMALTGDALQIKVFDAPLGSLWQQITQESERAILAHPACDRYGRLSVQIDSNLLPVVDRGGIPVVHALLKQDWHNRIGFERVILDAAAQINLSGVAYAGGSAATRFSVSPGRVPKTFGNIQRKERLALGDQTISNELTGLVAGKANNEYPALDIELAANHRMVDICPHQYLQLSVTAADTERGIVLTDFYIIPRRCSFRYDPATGELRTDITCEGYTLPELAITGDPPATPPAPPPIPLPPLPPAPLPPALWEGDVQMAVGWNSSQIGLTLDLLRHQVVSTGKTGTTGTTLIDTSLDDQPAADYNDVPIEVGHLVENLEPGAHFHERTTIAAIVSGSELTLAADIGLGVGDAYHISGTEWHDISGTIDLAVEDVIDFAYIRTGAATVGAWLLTDAGVWYTANILTSAVSWSSKLNLANIRSGALEIGAAAIFKSMSVDRADTGYLVVNCSGGDNYDPDMTVESALETSNSGGSWSKLKFSPSLQWGPNGQTNIAPKSADWLSVQVSDGNVYAVRGISGYGPTNLGYVDIWINGALVGGYRVDRISYLYKFYGLLIIDGAIYVHKAMEAAPWDWALGVSTDGGQTFSSIDPVSYNSATGFGSLSGAYDDAGNLWIIASDATPDCLLLHSTTGGASWVEVANAKDLFGGGCSMCNFSVATAPYVWEADADVLCWSGRLKLSSYTFEFLFYSDTAGLVWLNKRGDWIAEFGDWIGDDGSSTSGCNALVPLPRVGANE